MVISPFIQQITVVQRTANNRHSIVCKEVLLIFKRKNFQFCMFINLQFTNYDILEIQSKNI